MGDYFDYITYREGSTGIRVADVSSRGLGPALLMVEIQACIRALADTHADPGKLVSHAKRLFARNDQALRDALSGLAR